MTDNPVQHLLESGARILGSSDTPDAQLDAIQEYSAELEKWLETNKAKIAEGTIAKEDVEALTANHSAILALVDTLKEENKDARLGLRQRGKAMLKYIDVLPGKVGAMRKKKG